MRLRRKHNQHAFEGINVTPMIDVVMCLIIFFLLVGKLATDRGAAVRLPESRVGDSEKAPDTLTVNVMSPERAGAAGAAWLSGTAVALVDDRPVGSAEIMQELVKVRLAERPQLAIQIRADRDLTFSTVEPVLRACGKAGAKSVRLATEKVR